MDAMSCIFARRSVREFIEDKKVSEQAIENMLRAGCSAPSAKNGKPWRFIVIQDKKTIATLASLKKNYEKSLSHAPLAIAVLFDKNDDSYKANPEYRYQDCAAATQNMLLAATAQGLGTCWLGGLMDQSKMQEIDEVLGIKDGMRFFCLIAVGHSNEVKKPKGFLDDEKVFYEMDPKTK